MPTTPKFQIPYPDGNSNYTPLQDWFAGIANGVEAALNTGLGGAPRIANSDSERNIIYPSPVQGNTVLRPDKGYTEQYFGTYDVSTNPAGRTPSGWYPVTPSPRGGLPVMPFAIATGSTVPRVVAANGWSDQAITFPVGRFSQPPLLIASNTGSVDGFGFITATSVTTTGCNIRHMCPIGSAQIVGANWIAIQMTAAAAIG